MIDREASRGEQTPNLQELLVGIEISPQVISQLKKAYWENREILYRSGGYIAEKEGTVDGICDILGILAYDRETEILPVDTDTLPPESFRLTAEQADDFTCRLQNLQEMAGIRQNELHALTAAPMGPEYNVKDYLERISDLAYAQSKVAVVQGFLQGLTGLDAVEVK